MKKTLKNHKGITLIALIVTIIVLLILAGVTIGTITGQKGTIKQANDAKDQTEIAQEKEILNNAVVYAIGKDTSGKVTKKYLDPELDQSIGAGKYTSDDQTTSLGIIVTYTDSGRSYFVDTSGNVTDFDGTVPLPPDNTLEIGDYVKYDVSYTDMYTDYDFTEEDGWRVLDPGEENPDGTYTGVKLISTGVPANLYYYYYAIKSKETDKTEGNEGTVGLWAGNEAQRKNYLELFNPANRVESDYNIYAAAGLYYNFGLIKFTQGENPSKNVGGYLKVNGKTSGEITGKEFIIEEAEEVHNLTLKELNQARGESETSTTSTSSKDGAMGLFYLKGLGEEFGYTASVSPYYWLASPATSNVRRLNSVDYAGTFTISDGDTYGVRPVVSLKSNIQIEEIER